MSSPGDYSDCVDSALVRRLDLLSREWVEKTQKERRFKKYRDPFVMVRPPGFRAKPLVWDRWAREQAVNELYREQEERVAHGLDAE